MKIEGLNYMRLIKGERSKEGRKILMLSRDCILVGPDLLLSLQDSRYPYPLYHLCDQSFIETQKKSNSLMHYIVGTINDKGECSLCHETNSIRKLSFLRNLRIWNGNM